VHTLARNVLALLCTALTATTAAAQAWPANAVRIVVAFTDGVNFDSARALEAALATRRSNDRPLVIGATIDPAQYAAQF